MALSLGARLGSYEIVARLGTGGMGEVYRARDAELDRDVAIKILLSDVAHDPERLLRFRREAQVLAALDHPSIAHIYGLEGSDGVRAIVMELVEGPTLADRIAQGPIPLDEALSIAKQIAEAVMAAHEQGIIHRDLKPANIKITPDGVVKVLDFGLAKLAHPEVVTRGADVAASPTITSPALVTGVGVLLGTAAYMSPEQAKGREADKRSDVSAFGCVLYEMLTGKRAFDGEDMTEVLGAVVRLEPKWEALSPDVPQPVRTLLQRCLVKDRRTRIADIAAALFVLDHQAGAATSMASAAPLRGRPLWRHIAAMTAGALVVASIAATLTWFATRPGPPLVVRTTVTTSGSTALTLSGNRDIAITPDGSRIVYSGNNQLLVRAVDRLEPHVLSGLVALQGVFISPDGQWVGFFDGRTIKKVAIAGGPPVTITPVDGPFPRGATWGPDGTIVYGTNAPSTGLQRVSAAGGEPTVLTKPDRERGESDHFWPEFLPGGEAVLFTITPATGGVDNAQVAVLDLRTGTSKVLIDGGSHAHYVPTGHLLYGIAGTLRAVAFDLGRLEIVGTPAPVLEGVVTTPGGAAQVAVATNGSLVYVPGGPDGDRQRSIVSRDRQGRVSPLPGLPLDSYRDIRVSPDGARLVVATQDDVWIYDLTRGTLSPLTTHPGPDTRPLWTPDGQRIIFTSRRAGYPELFWRPADGTGSDERLLAREKDLFDLRGSGWSADGRELLFTEVSPGVPRSTGRNASGSQSHLSTLRGLTAAIGQMAIARPSDAKVLVKNEFYNDWAAASPDGRWMAYSSDMSGKYEVYIERYPELGSRQQISTGGGRLPLWSRDGRELFFGSLDGRQMMAVGVQPGTTLVIGRPQVLFELAILVPSAGNHAYDIGPDGRFFMIRSGQPEAGGVTPSAQLVIVQNWFEELKRLVPPN